MFSPRRTTFTRAPAARRVTDEQPAEYSTSEDSRSAAEPNARATAPHRPRARRISLPIVEEAVGRHRAQTGAGSEVLAQHRREGRLAHAGRRGFARVSARRRRTVRSPIGDRSCSCSARARRWPAWPPATSRRSRPSPSCVAPRRSLPECRCTSPPHTAWKASAAGLVVASYEGRPTKIEGNPDHRDSLGGTTSVRAGAAAGPVRR